MCLYGDQIRNPKYKANKKNGGHPPPILDTRTKYVQATCGKCMECRKQKANAWRIRLMEDIKTNTNGIYITLTMSNQKYKEVHNQVQQWVLHKGKLIPRKNKLQGYELDNEIAKRAVRRFLERWRKENKTSVRHWLITELGHEGTENIHLHGLIWTDNHYKDIEKHWQYGFVWDGYTQNEQRINYVNNSTINYMIKYVNKADEDHPNYRSIILTSSGIGRDYINNPQSQLSKYKDKKTQDYYRTEQGTKLSLPQYYRNKLYNDEEKEKLWLQKLDKQEKYIAGEKVSIKDGDTQYWKLVYWYRKINKQLGYGSNERNYDQLQNELERRIRLNNTRLQKAEEKENTDNKPSGFKRQSSQRT